MLTDLISSLQTPEWSHMGENSFTSSSVQLQERAREEMGLMMSFVKNADTGFGRVSNYE